MVQRFDVYAVSGEFLEVLRDMPEASSASWVKIGNKKIEGATQILTGVTPQEIEQQLPKLAAQFVESGKPHFRMIERISVCSSCSGKNPDCTHPIGGLVSFHRALDIDLKKLLELHPAT